MDHFTSFSFGVVIALNLGVASAADGQIGNCRQGSHSGNGWTDSYPQPSGAEPYERLGLAFAVLLTNPGIPLIYYGDEIGLAGGGDPDNRRLMPWSDDTLSEPQLALREQITALATIRAENPVLGRGRRITRSADTDTWVYSMTGCGDASPAVTVALNRSGADATVQVPAGDYFDLLSSSDQSGGAITVPARGIRVLRAR